jgi:hypothetical protein
MRVGSKLLRSRSVIAAAMVLGSIVPVAVLTGAPATASPGHVRVVGQNILECEELVGRITFQPPWNDSRAGRVTATVSFTSRSCGGQDNPTPIPVKVEGHGKVTFANGTCTAHSSTSLPIKGHLSLPIKGHLRLIFGSPIAPSTLILDPTSANGDGITSNGSLGDDGTVTGSYPTPAGGGFWGVVTASRRGTCAKGITTWEIPFADSGTGLQA